MNKPSAVRQPDAVDVILEQWRRERPDLDVSPMGPIGRITRCAALLAALLESAYAPFDLALWEFDMLAALRRSGAPYRLTPTALFSSLMVTSGTMTHRLKRLEARGLIERLPNEHDARSLLVQLSADGLALIDRAVVGHVDNERALLSELPKAALASLEAGMSELLAVLEQRPGVSGVSRD